MFKDYDKYLKASLKVYLFVLIIIFILKLVGLDYFGLDTNNALLIKASDYLSNTHWGDLYCFITVYIQAYFMLCLSVNKNKLYKETLIFSIILYTVQCLINTFYSMNGVYQVISILWLLIYPMIINKKFCIKRQFIVVALVTLYQPISMFIRSVGINTNYNNLLVESLLNLDQLLMLAIAYNLCFMKGGIRLCGVEVEALSSLQMKKNFSNLLKKLQRNYSNFKQLNKQEKATIIIYSILSLFWNVFTLVVVLLIGKLNDTLIECIFIITSFWLSKKVFGKPFHLKSMLQCFILSNVTYYVLNRITTPLGISILVPIMLGVGLSYITSKLVKKTYKPLYKGMPKEEFENAILKVVDKDSYKYKICYDYFIENENAIILGRRYNYTAYGIRKIASRVNDNIKALNK